MNIAYCLSKRNRRVLFLDCDPQGNASLTLCSESPFEIQPNLYEVFMKREIDFSLAAHPTKYKNLDIIPANINAGTVPVEIHSSDPRRFLGLQSKFDASARENYDYVIIDCPPALDSLFLTNAIIISDFYVVPVEAESPYGMTNVKHLIAHIKTIKETALVPVELLGALITRFDQRTIASKVILETVNTFFGKHLTFKNPITRNAACHKALIKGQPVCEYDSGCSASKAFRRVTDELMERVEMNSSNEMKIAVND